MVHEQAMELERQQANVQAEARDMRDSTVRDLIDHLAYCDDLRCDCGGAPDSLF